MKDRFEEILELSRARTLVVLRQPEIMFWVFGFPLLLAVVLGFAFRSTGVEGSLVGILPGTGRADLAARLAGEEHLVLEQPDDPEEARRDLRSGRLDVLIEPGDPPLLHLHEARPQSETARLRIVRALERPPRPAGDGPPPVARIVPVEERGARYIDFLFPGLLGLNLMGTGMWSIGFAVADLRQRKLLRRMLVTPMRRSSFLASLLAFRLGFLAFELATLTLFGIFLLGVPFRGSLLGFCLLALLGALAFAGLGMLAAARVRTVEGASGMLNLVMMPMWLASGVFFSYERFPAAIQPVLRALPLTALNDALRDLMLDGRSLAATAPEIGILALWGVAGFALALRLFRWE